MVRFYPISNAVYSKYWDRFVEREYAVRQRRDPADGVFPPAAGKKNCGAQAGGKVTCKKSRMTNHKSQAS
jgi:hypothetical protein